MKTQLQLLALLLLIPLAARGQVNSGSTGADGAFNPTTNTVVDMSDHPTGIYHYTAVNIPAGVTVTFTPNAANTPVVWLVQSDAVINGTVDISANTSWNGSWHEGPITVQNGGPGGFRGGNGGTASTPGQGVGGGNIGGPIGGNASFATAGAVYTNSNFGGFSQGFSGLTHGNIFLVPLLGGSGGGGSPGGFGGGGGGAIMIAASGTITLNGSIFANGSAGGYVSLAYIDRVPQGGGGGGSGGGIRLIASHLVGTGNVNANGSGPYAYDGWITDYFVNSAGAGRIRFDTIDNAFSGSISGAFTQGFQPVVVPRTGQGVQLAVQSVAGAAVAAVPTGVLANPDAIIPGQQSNPVAIVVRCTNLPLNTPVTVTVKPANGAAISAVGYNTSGTLASSTATVSLNMPRGGGIIYATAATGN